MTRVSNFEHVDNHFLTAKAQGVEDSLKNAGLRPALCAHCAQLLPSFISRLIFAFGVLVYDYPTNF
jgi:hypothetical protein